MNPYHQAPQQAPEFTPFSGRSYRIGLDGEAGAESMSVEGLGGNGFSVPVSPGPLPPDLPSASTGGGPAVNLEARLFPRGSR